MGDADFSAVRLLQRIAVLANEADSFDQAIQTTLDAVCEYASWPVGHAYLAKPSDPTRLVSTDLWHLDHRRRYDTFVEVTSMLPLQRGIGLPGRVLESGRPAWIRDVLLDTNFPRARTGRDIRVRGAFATPVLAGRDIVGVLEFFSDDPEPQDDRLLEVASYSGTQLGRVYERERHAADLHAQVTQTRRLIDSAYDAFVAIDEKGRIETWNHAAEEMFGWTHDEAIGHGLAETIIPARFRDQHYAGLNRFLATRSSRVMNQRIELAALRKSGEEFPIELAIWAVEDDDRMTFCALVHDITERRAREEERRITEERIKTSEQRLRAAQEMAAVGSWEWAIDGNSLYWSDQLYRNFGVSPETFSPSFETCIELVHPDDRPKLLDVIHAALEQGSTFELDHRIIRQTDGSTRVHFCQGRVVTVEGRKTGLAGTSQDVTERRRNEDALQNAYEREREMVCRLEELDTARTEFVSAVSHELRTPLTSIIGYLQLVMEMGHEIADEHLEMLDVVDRNSQRLLALIEDLLTKSRMESGTFDLKIAPVDVRVPIEAAVRAVMPGSVDRNILLDIEIDPELGSIDADGAQIERLLLNLLSNAIKFTEDGSIRVSATREADDVVISVADTGIGIAPDEIPKLFSPFFRTEIAEKTTPGTGLGLVLVKTIVDAHSGSIVVNSKPGEGTTIVVRLPVVYRAASAA